MTSCMNIKALLHSFLPPSSPARWQQGVHSQIANWLGCCASAAARSAARGPSAHSRPPYRPTPGLETPPGSPHLPPPSCGCYKLVQRPICAEKEEKSSCLETLDPQSSFLIHVEYKD